MSRPARVDQFAQFRFTRRHRLPLIDQVFVTLPFRRDREPQLVQCFGRLLFLQSRLLARFRSRRVLRLLLGNCGAQPRRLLFELRDARRPRH